jgi:glycosyltransferase involved in cell wall biosynthesis
MSPTVSIVLPAYNEEAMLRATVDELVAGMRDRSIDFEILIEENGSTDSTQQVGETLAAAHDEVRFEHTARADYGRALRQGLLNATGGVVVNFDVDYYDLGFLDAAVPLVSGGAASIVVGSKRSAGAQDERPPLRRLVTAVFATLLRIGFGLKVSDTHGMKALDRAVTGPLAERCVLGTDLFDTELVLRAERAGVVVAELPVRVEERRPARSSVVRRIARTLVGLVKLRRALRAG